MLGKERIKMAKFALVGIVNTGVDFAIFVLLVYALGVPAWLAQIVSYGGGVANSFWLNRRWTFRAAGSGSHWQEALRFAAVNGASFAAATAVLLGLHEGLAWSPLAAKVVSVFFATAVNYAGSRYWVFRNHRRERQSS